MAVQEVKLYQVGTFVVGNRLLDPEQRSVQAGADRSNAITSGHRACQGCGEVLGARYVLDAAMRATGGNLVAAGRCMDGDAAALSSTRVMGPCMAMGMAAAHALDLAGSGSVHQIDPAALQARVKDNVEAKVFRWPQR